VSILAGGERGQLSRRSPSDGTPGTRWAFVAGLRRSQRLIDNHRTMRRTNHDRLGRSRHAWGMGPGEGAHERMRCHREGDHEQHDSLQRSRPSSHVACILHSGRQGNGWHTTVGGICTFQTPVRSLRPTGRMPLSPYQHFSCNAGTPSPGIWVCGAEPQTGPGPHVPAAMRCTRRSRRRDRLRRDSHAKTSDGAHGPSPGTLTRAHAFLVRGWRPRSAPRRR
jgi:hypothetical protein